MSFIYKNCDATIYGTVQSKLNQDEVIIDFAGKAGSFLDANKPENWKPIQGKIVSKYPVMNFIQIKKEDLFY